jgi:capsule polysaccharide export protein KpsE/RkpR
MTMQSSLATLEREDSMHRAIGPAWALRAMLLWKHRRILTRVTGISLLLSLLIAFTIPKEYKSTAKIMPPDQPSSGAMMLAALASHSTGFGALSNLASGLLGGHTSGALFVDLLRSGTVSGRLIDQFNLQHVYRTRYRVDAAKRLAHLTTITEDKKSGVITITVEDRSRVRARDLAQAYLDELNKLVARTNTSAAHRERVFLEQRLHAAQADLEQAELQLSQFSSKSNAIDIKEQTHAMVDAGERVQAELLVEQSGLQSLRQIYGDGNVRVRETEASIANLQRELARMSGASASLPPEQTRDEGGSDGNDNGQLYPSLRQIPRLAVPYADLSRRVKVQESVFELLTEQYEMARIEEAKDVPVVSVIDSPGIAEKKAFPPRLRLALLLTLFIFATVSGLILAREHWSTIDADDPRRALAMEVLASLRRRVHSILSFRGGVA